jgi:hypothetical protein
MARTSLRAMAVTTSSPASAGPLFLTFPTGPTLPPSPPPGGRLCKLNETSESDEKWLVSGVECGVWDARCGV